MANIYSYLLQGIIESAKNGYREKAIEALESILHTLENGRDLIAEERAYLIDCIKGTLANDKKDANLGFNLKYPRGVQKKYTFERDYEASLMMHYPEDESLSYDARLANTVATLNKKFSEAPCDKKTVEAAYTSFRPHLNGDFDEE